jgi:hypothetical protein
VTRRRDSQGIATGDGVILVLVLVLGACVLGWPLAAFHGPLRNGAFAFSAAGLWVEAGSLAFLFLVAGLPLLLSRKGGKS